MPELVDKKLERFAQELLMNLASGMAPGKAATGAASKAGYRGSSLGPNARKRAQRKDVKARMSELAAPAVARVEEEIGASYEAALAKLWKIASVPLRPEDVLPHHITAAISKMAEMSGWNAPEKREHGLSDPLTQLLNEIDGRTRDPTKS